MNASPHAVAATMMSPEEARKRVIVINSGMNNIRALLLDFYEREGWKALGYASWRECVTAEFGQSQRHLYRQLEAAQIEERINQASVEAGEKAFCPMGQKAEEGQEAVPFDAVLPEKTPIPERILRPLAEVAPEDQPTVYHLAKETAPGKLTAAHVEKTVREVVADAPKVYRIQNTKTGEWWEGEATGKQDACYRAKWPDALCFVRQKTPAGGWKNVSKSEPKKNTARGMAGGDNGMVSESPRREEANGVAAHRVPHSPTAMVVCRLAFSCAKAAGCAHGKNHATGDQCASGEVCYDRVPAERAWCEIVDEPALIEPFPPGKKRPPEVVQIIINYIELIKDTDPDCKESLRTIAVHVWNRQHRRGDV